MPKGGSSETEKEIWAVGGANYHHKHQLLGYAIKNLM